MVTIDAGSRASSRFEWWDSVSSGIHGRGRLGRFEQESENLGRLGNAKSATSGWEKGDRIDFSSGRDFSVRLCLFPSLDTVP